MGRGGPLAELSVASFRDCLCWNLALLALTLGSAGAYLAIHHCAPTVALLLPAGTDAPLNHHPRAHSIDLSRKIFFYHIHKASGASFVDVLLSMRPRVQLCDFVGKDRVGVRSTAELAKWWFDDALRPNCSFVTMEFPPLGRTATNVALQRPLLRRVEALALPQLLSFYRDPADRCASHWLYEQRLCRLTRQRHSNYCRGFVRQFSRLADPKTHEAFARTYCTDPISTDYARHGFNPKSRFAFVGITERFAASVCLFWHEARALTAREWASLCGCGTRAELLARLPHDAHGVQRPTATAHAEHAASLDAPANTSTTSVIPELCISRDELLRRNLGDLGLYRHALYELERRATAVERKLNVSFFQCPPL
jgi:hypothetical protein